MSSDGEHWLASCVLSYLRESGVVALLRTDRVGQITGVDGAWAELLGESDAPLGSAIEERIGHRAAEMIRNCVPEHWSAVALVWRNSSGALRPLDARSRVVGDELLIVLSPGLWSEDRALAELSKVHERLTNTERALHRRNRELEEARALLAELATRDPLTGLANRRLLDETLGRAVSYARRHGEPLSVIAADLDHFKRVNDSHGHAAGDHVLEAFARLLDRSTRREDLAARIGGEEFVIVLPGTSSAGARVVAERLRQGLGSLDVGPATPVTVSLGVAEFGDGDTAALLIERADGALYEAKRCGRNRVVVAGED